MNVASIPIVMIGTPKANEILQEDLRSARRSAGLGSLIWEPMRNEAPTPDPSTHDQMIISEWHAFTNKLWQYQWVQQPAELTDELRATWYHYTQGIPDLVVKLFCLVQIHAITIGLEKSHQNYLKGLRRTIAASPRYSRCTAFRQSCTYCTIFRPHYPSSSN